MTTTQQRVCLQFKDVSYTIADKTGGKPIGILHNISGEFTNGQLTAILGPSGAGKTSLLNILSGFKMKGVTGTVTINGRERNMEDFRKQSCYVTQNITMLSQLTSRETLTVAAHLKLQPGWENRSDTSSAVSNIFELLGLTGTEDTRVEYLSGGEKKRLSIGMELITNPSIMFVDEPTSGLDSSSTVQVMTRLQTLRDLGHIVICVIHQPSSRVFHMFDQIYLVVGGRCLYSGRTDKMAAVFEEAGFKSPPFYNLADYVLEVATRERGEDVSKLVAMFQTSQVKLEPYATKDALATDRLLPTSIVCDNINTEPHTYGERRSYPTTQWNQFTIILKRSLTCTFRDLYTFQVRVFSHIAVGLLLGFFYFGIGNEASLVDTNVSSLLFVIMFIFFCTSMTTVLTFPLEKAVIIREHLNNWYSLPAYYWAKLVADMPLQIVCPISFVLIVYFMSDQPSEIRRVLMTLLPCQLTALVAQAVGMSIGAAFGIQLGTLAVPLSTFPMLLFSGFFLRIKYMPFYLRWLAEISYFKHGFEATMIAIYGFNRPNLVCSQPYCHFKNPDKLLDHFGMSEESYWFDIAGLCIWSVVIHIGLFAALKLKIHGEK